MIRALVFDLDGLIIDTELPEFISWQEQFEAHGARLRLEDWAAVIGTADLGNPYDWLESAVGGPVDRAAVRTARRARFAELMADEAIRPGVEATLRRARELGLRVGLASSSSAGWVTGLLDTYGLSGRFDAVRTGDDVTQTKPSPELYVRVLEALDVPAEAAVALEDSPNGIAAAKAAGLVCVAVPNELTRQLRLTGADLVLDSLELSLDDLLSQAYQRLPSPPR